MGLVFVREDNVRVQMKGNKGEDKYPLLLV